MFIGIIYINLTDHNFLQIEYIWVSGHLPRIIMCSDLSAEQALDTGIYIIRSRVYHSHLYDAMLLIVLNLQARYFGLCYVMYVYACQCCDTYQLIRDRFARIYALCMFKPSIPKGFELTHLNESRELIPTWPCKGDSPNH